jgi:hypothetical protein
VWLQALARFEPGLAARKAPERVGEPVVNGVDSASIEIGSREEEMGDFPRLAS